MGMTREEATKHLENMKLLKGYSNTTVNGVPLENVIDGIIALLKAQEPRVMTLEEVTEDRPDVVWFDDRHYKLTYPVFISNGEVTGWIVSQSRGCMERHDHVEGYGKRWRCWTSRPTDEQREAEPWES